MALNSDRLESFGIRNEFHLDFVQWPPTLQFVSQQTVHIANELTPPKLTIANERIQLCCLVIQDQSANNLKNIRHSSLLAFPLSTPTLLKLNLSRKFRWTIQVIALCRSLLSIISLIKLVAKPVISTAFRLKTKEILSTCFGFRRDTIFSDFALK